MTTLTKDEAERLQEYSLVLNDLQRILSWLDEDIDACLCADRQFNEGSEEFLTALFGIYRVYYPMNRSAK